ncbi:hypothetical protein BDV23DRAFT_146042 [Aspergillus alliaceus]|uniref:Uncharacterized protein n=1 Tax=Petromyces alliaceus TaxID=209559 RepID=A0A5N7CLB7_PETAA|nr:hypothetical protein BDV23DRAFT_146042 [Aspergillus alliaceus]
MSYILAVECLSKSDRTLLVRRECLLLIRHLLTLRLSLQGLRGSCCMCITHLASVDLQRTWLQLLYQQLFYGIVTANQRV